MDLMGTSVAMDHQGCYRWETNVAMIFVSGNKAGAEVANARITGVNKVVFKPDIVAS